MGDVPCFVTYDDYKYDLDVFEKIKEDLFRI